jgi:trehalose 6-phosphate phosphatase
MEKELNIQPAGGQESTGVTRSLQHHPSALEKRDEIFCQLCRGTPAIFLDYDGTLAPIVDDPAAALISEKMRDTVRKLSENYQVAIISGRDLKDVKILVGVDNIVYAGSHGFDIAYPGNSGISRDKWQRYLPALDRAEAELRSSLQHISGALVERKRFTVAVHYRKVDKSEISKVEEAVDNVAGRHHELRKSFGKKVFELRPDVDWDKGKALLSLVETLYTDSAQVVPLFIGDDVTDEDAFQSIKDSGVGIRVGKSGYRTAARYLLKDPAEVMDFLNWLATNVVQDTKGDH